MARTLTAVPNDQCVSGRVTPPCSRGSMVSIGEASPTNDRRSVEAAAADRLLACLLHVVALVLALVLVLVCWRCARPCHVLRTVLKLETDGHRGLFLTRWGYYSPTPKTGGGGPLACPTSPIWPFSGRRATSLGLRSLAASNQPTSQMAVLTTALATSLS